MRKDYKGWACDEIISGIFKCIVTLDVGPRVISFTIADGPNLFYEFSSDENAQNDGNYRHFGGHRLWTTPESLSYTYHPENIPVEILNGFYCSAPDLRGIQKGLKITPIAEGFLVEHKLTNVGNDIIETSPWGITMVKPGGYAIFPNEPENPNGLLPVRTLSLWPYTKMNDPRLIFNDQFTIVKHESGKKKFKIGAYISQGWGAYVLDSMVFHKTFSGRSDIYPDLGANFEIYTDENLLETETTGVVRRLNPGESINCSEIWQGFQSTPENLFELCCEGANAVKNLVN